MSDPFSQARPKSPPGPPGARKGSHGTCAGSLRLLELIGSSRIENIGDFYESLTLGLTVVFLA